MRLQKTLIMTLMLLLIGSFFGCTVENTVKNRAPVARAGMDQDVVIGVPFTLDAGNSSDLDGDTLTYRWHLANKPLGSYATLNDESLRNPKCIADVQGKYRFELVVTDGQLSSLKDEVVVTALVSGTQKSIVPSTGLQASNQIFKPLSTTLATRKMLVILLSYDDVAIEGTASEWSLRMFGNNQGELNHYYSEISQQQFAFEAVSDGGNVSDGVVQVQMQKNHPDPNIDSSNFYAVLHPELKNALETVVADGFNLASYDTDNDGLLTPDELLITFIMAGEEDAYSGGGITKGVWAHVDCVSDTYKPSVGVDAMACSSSGNYAVFGEKHYDNLNTSHLASVGIIAHELGHSAFHLPDLYSGGDTRIGYYGLMGNGSWGQVSTSDVAGSSPTHMTPWSKIDVGWFSAQKSHNDANSSLTLSATGMQDYSIIKVPLRGSSNEYFLIENRGASGYDEGLKFVNPNYIGGMAIWHIDASIIASRREQNDVNGIASHKGVDLEEAAGESVDSGNGDPLKNLYYSGNVDAFTPNTAPNTNLYSGQSTQLFVTDISAPSSMMTLKINNPL